MIRGFFSNDCAFNGTVKLGEVGVSLASQVLSCTRIECRNSEPFAGWMSTLEGSLAVTTYQAGKMALLGWRAGQLSLLMRQFNKAMGLAVAPGKMAVATQHEITLLANAPCERQWPGTGSSGQELSSTAGAARLCAASASEPRSLSSIGLPRSKARHVPDRRCTRDSVIAPR